MGQLRRRRSRASGETWVDAALRSAQEMNRGEQSGSGDRAQAQIPERAQTEPVTEAHGSGTSLAPGSEVPPIPLDLSYVASWRSRKIRSTNASLPNASPSEK